MEDARRDYEYTFIDGTHREKTLFNDMIAYRVYGDHASLCGRFLTIDRIFEMTHNEIRHRFSLVCNGVLFIAIVRIPSSTRVEFGRAAPLEYNGTQLRGGGTQILLPTNFPPEWVSRDAIPIEDET
jgi:hypothetical protein